MPSISIVIAPRPFAGAGTASWRRSTTTGTNAGAAGSARRPAPPYAKRTDAAARYRAGAPPPTGRIRFRDDPSLASSLQRRRRPTPTRISTRHWRRNRRKERRALTALLAWPRLPILR
jgi:hypothetical protein